MPIIREFGQKYFASLFNCRTYSLGSLPWDIYRRLDHGFIADRACVWDKRLEGNEIAIVSRTYLPDDEIDNPPAGLRTVRLPDLVMGKGEPGTPIATVICGNTIAAEMVLSACSYMPADMLGYAISRDMVDDGLCICLDVRYRTYPPDVKIIKIPWNPPAPWAPPVSNQSSEE
jgi:hypothetical protein